MTKGVDDWIEDDFYNDLWDNLDEQIDFDTLSLITPREDYRPREELIKMMQSLKWL